MHFKDFYSILYFSASFEGFSIKMSFLSFCRVAHCCFRDCWLAGKDFTRISPGFHSGTNYPKHSSIPSRLGGRPGLGGWLGGLLGWLGRLARVHEDSQNIPQDFRTGAYYIRIPRVHEDPTRAPQRSRLLQQFSNPGLTGLAGLLAGLAGRAG